MVRWRMISVAVSVVGLVAAGCSDDSDDISDATATTVEETRTIPVEEETTSAEMVVVEFNEALLSGDVDAAEALLSAPLGDDDTGAVARFHVSTVPGPLRAGGPGFPGTEYTMRDPFPWGGLYLDDFGETEIISSDGDTVTVRWVYEWTAPEEGWEFWCDYPAEGSEESPAFVVDPGAVAVVAYQNEVAVSEDGFITRIEGAECGELVSTSAGEDETDVDVALEWTLAATFDGWLEDPVVDPNGPFVDPILALFRTVGNDGYPSEDAELWISVDGVEWGPAPNQPPRPVDDLVAHDANVFALRSFDGGGLWALAPDGWREVMADERIQGVAVGPERVVVYHDGAVRDPFELLGVFEGRPGPDHERLDPVEFSGLPDLGVEGLLYEGRVVALDDGFLADVNWLLAPEEGEDPLRPDVTDVILYSADGSTWVAHPTVTSDDVRVWTTSFWQGPIFHDGVNLVAGPDGESLLVTDDGLDFDEVPSPVGYPNVVTATEAGFFVVGGGAPGPEAFHSTDGRMWRSLEMPPTWAGGEIGEEGFVSGTVLTVGDDLYAFTIRGVPQGFGAVEDPVTEIWRTDAPDL